MLRIALIPARGGSKRIPRKNIRLFDGLPIIQYSIDAALKSSAIDKVVVSTDDEEIADVARKHGAEVPFMRPKNISDDFATTMDVLQHALSWSEKHYDVEAICCLYPTAPFVKPVDLEKSYEIFSSKKASFVFSATEFPFPIQRAFKIKDGLIELFQPEFAVSRSQDLVPAYHDAGQFYWCQSDAIRNSEHVFGQNSAAFLLDRSRVQDIDTPEDWYFAEKLFQAMK